MKPQNVSSPAFAEIARAPPPLTPGAEAASGFGRLPREQSARDSIWPWQALALALVAAGAVWMPMLPDGIGLAILTALLAVPFGFGAVIRLISLWHGLAPGGYGREWAEAPPVSDWELPRYSVLVPLYREARVVPGLVAALADLDYPPARLEIVLVVEAVDRDTQAAITAEVLPSHMRMAVVPDGQPRTKPRAINHALGLTSGAYVVVYDAEDQPEPDQLKRALAVLRSDPERIGCVQAALNVDNDTGWLTRQFKLEYTGLFDLTLPALDRCGMVVPLGGTSNHFPRRVLEQMHGWDSYNVTEDADLGIRLARAGYRVATLPSSTTWEECPERFRVWLGQRTRWLKGWMQTWLVHTRRPGRLAADLGAWKFVTLQLLLANLVLSPLAHPWLYVVLAARYAAGEPLGPPDDVAGAALWWVSAANIGIGYAAAVALAAMAVARRGWPALFRSAFFVPFYWLAISLAAYRALGQLVRAPHFWEKTEHKGRTRGGRTRR